MSNEFVARFAEILIEKIRQGGNFAAFREDEPILDVSVKKYVFSAQQLFV